ncbi:MAG: hypothetical protein DI604_27145, partial [Delftia acidovorans]
SGQATALRERLRQARQQAGGASGHAALLDALQACADRFDFDALARLLPQPREEDEQEQEETDE